MPDPRFPRPAAQWTVAERREYETLVAAARNEAMQAGNPDVQCESTGSLGSAQACFANTHKKTGTGCAHCAGALAAASKQAELTGYDPTRKG